MSRLLIHLLFPLLIFFLTPAVPSALASPNVKETAPDFELLDLSGQGHKLSDYRGKVVIMNFWATWCPECIMEMPSLQRLSEQLKKEDFAVIGISIDRSRTDVERLPAGISYPILLDQKGDVFVKKYTITRLPVTIIINRDGAIAEKLFGTQDFMSDKFIAKIKKLLGQGSRE